MIWHSSTTNDIVSELNSDVKRGLSRAQAQALLSKYGENRLLQPRSRNFFERFLHQLKKPIMLALILASVVSIVYTLFIADNNWLKPTVLIVFSLAGALISAAMENHAESVLRILRKKDSQTARVIRDGTLETVNTALLVPGDIILLESGDYIPADARLVEAVGLRCDESMLTGESVHAEKEADELCADITALSERKNMVFYGCSVSSGSAKAIVTETGMDTEIGKITVIAKGGDRAVTPMQKQLSSFSRTAGLVTLVLCAIIFLYVYIRGINSSGFYVLDTLLTVLSLAVSVIPKGLAAVVTVCMAMGVQRMLAQNAVIRKLEALETLDSVSVICTDKTGNLTQNKMTVVQAYVGEKIYYVVDDFSQELTALLRIGALCCNGSAEVNGFETVQEGDPTEAAIVEAAIKHLNMDKTMLDSTCPRMCEIPFDPERKLMSVVCIIDGRPFAIVKGGAEIIIEHCRDFNKEAAQKASEAMAKDSLRVLGIAIKPLEEIPSNPTPEEIETDLTFAGLVGLIDPPQQEVKSDIDECKSAGIRTIMITGDHIATATAIAKRLGILEEGQLAISGEELSAMDDEQLAEKITDISVYARVSPEDKKRIVSAWQAHGEVVAMTGGTVDDAPALQVCDIGCAMGKDGTDVAKGAASVVLADNSYTTVAGAIREGRGIYQNIRNMIHYILSCNLSLLVAGFFGMLIFRQSPLTSAQLLWLSLIASCIPSATLGLEPAPHDVMTRKPRRKKNVLLSPQFGVTVLWQGFVMGAVAIVAYIIGINPEVASTMAFASMYLVHVLQVICCRFDGLRRCLDIIKSRYVLIGLAASLVLFLLVMFLPPLKTLFGIAMISFAQLMICFALALVPTVATLVVRAVFYKRSK